MKKIACILCLLQGAVLPLAPVFPQAGPGRFSIAVFGGPSLPLAPQLYRDYWKSAFGFGGEIRMRWNNRTAVSIGFSRQPFGLDEAAFKKDVDAVVDPLFRQMLDSDPTVASLRSQFPQMQIGWDNVYSGFGIQNTVWSLGISRCLGDPASPLVLSVTGGAGWYFQKMEDFGVETTVWFSEPTLGRSETTVNQNVEIEDTEEDDFGLNAGLALEWRMAKRLCLVIEGKYHFLFSENAATQNPPEGFEDWAREIERKSEGKVQMATFSAGLRFWL